MQKHATVRQLVEHHWLYLFRIDPHTSAVEVWSGGRWKTWVAAADSAGTS